MKAATARDEPEPFVRPRGIVAMQICRLSGKRPAAGCDAVPVSLEAGGHEERSMLVTEYFAGGTAPDDTCHLHVGRSLLGRFAGWVGAPASQAPQHSADHAEALEQTPMVAPVSPAQQAPAIATTPEPEKKRGFWSRVFGRRDRNAPEQPAEQKPDGKKPAPRPR